MKVAKFPCSVRNRGSLKYVGVSNNANLLNSDLSGLDGCLWVIRDGVCS